MKPLFAGIDLGGTSIKAAIAEADGTVLARDAVATESRAGPHAGLMGAIALAQQSHS